MAGSKSAAKELLKSYLNKRMRVAISDGRVIDGNFLCTDRDSNIVLGNCEEFSSQEVLGRLVQHDLMATARDLWGLMTLHSLQLRLSLTTVEGRCVGRHGR